MSTPKLLLATSMVAFCAFVSSCGDGGKAIREKATADSLALVAQADSIALVEKAEEDSIAAAAAAAAPKTIVYVANESAKKLAAAIKAADLEATLGDTSQKFTVFAPSDEAFAAAQTSVDELLKPENKAKLQSLLKHHVIVGSFKAASLKDGQIISTAEGTKVKFKVAGGKVTVDGANVTTADVETANGVIHVIDKVLTPKK
ncbi:MAG: fasciclin domain-containing protein [Bacteroidota bacterium]